MKTKCTANTKTNRPCRAWAIVGSLPPRCAAHSAAATSSLDDVAAALLSSQSHFTPYFDPPGDVDPLEFHGRLLDIYTPFVSRLLRAARDQDRRGPTHAQELDRAIDRVLDELSQSGDFEL